MSDTTMHGRRARHRELDPVTEPTNLIPLNLVKTGTGEHRKKNHIIAVTTGSLAIITAAGGMAWATTGGRQATAPASAQVPEGISAPDVLLTQPRVDVLTIPAPPMAEAPVVVPVVEAPPVTEVVLQAGDTVGDIAARYGKNVHDVLAANGLGPYSTVYAGDVLLLEGPPKPAPVFTPAAPSFVPAAPVITPAAPPLAPVTIPAGSREQLVYNAAMAQIGEYQDCVKMVADALATVGILHYAWPVEYYQIGYGISEAEAVPGDLIYYVDGGGGMAHIAVYAGNGMAIHGGFNGNETRLFSVYVGSGPNYIRVTA